ncbi:MAG TPA: hypothetical protein VFL16_01540 [Steroidobacteraceae bacterium]|nr:hypothetical protein [Steroidobacteraceae bacterium]
MKGRLAVLALVGCLSLVSTAAADCMGQTPRYLEMRVESCASAAARVQAAIEGKGYSDSQRRLVELSAQQLYVIRATPVAAVDLLNWFSDGSDRWYRGPRKPIQGEPARDYLVLLDGNCESLSTSKPHIFDANPEKPCRDFKLLDGNGKAALETDARLLVDLPEVAMFWAAERLENIDAARERLQNALDKRPSEAPR